MNRRTIYIGGTDDFDKIMISGAMYSVEQILDKVLIALKPTPIYRSGNFTTPVYTVQKGEAIGKVYSYLKPGQLTGGRSALMFYDAHGKAYYAFNENIDTSALKTQGAKTTKEQVKEEQRQEEKEKSGFEYYVRQYGVPLAFLVGIVVLSKEAIKGHFTAKK